MGSGAGWGPVGHSRPHVLSPEVETAATGHRGRVRLEKMCLILFQIQVNR